MQISVTSTNAPAASAMRPAGGFCASWRRFNASGEMKICSGSTRIFQSSNGVFDAWIVSWQQRMLTQICREHCEPDPSKPEQRCQIEPMNVNSFRKETRLDD